VGRSNRLGQPARLLSEWGAGRGGQSREIGRPVRSDNSHLSPTHKQPSRYHGDEHRHQRQHRDQCNASITACDPAAPRTRPIPAHHPHDSGSVIETAAPI